MHMFKVWATLGLGLVAMPAVAKEPTSAEADAPRTIEPTGIKEFDEVFLRAKAIHGSLDAAEAKMQAADDKARTALALDKGAALGDGLKNLQTKANGSIKLVRDGKKVSLSVDDAAPDDVKASVATLNESLADVGAAQDEAAGLEGESKQLAAAAAAFPGTVNVGMIKSSGLKPTELPKVTKTVNGNVKAVGETPTRASKVAAAGAAWVMAFEGAFAG